DSLPGEPDESGLPRRILPDSGSGRGTGRRLASCSFQLISACRGVVPRQCYFSAITLPNATTMPDTDGSKRSTWRWDMAKRLAVVGFGKRIQWLLHQLDTFAADVKLVAVVDPREDQIRKTVDAARLDEVTFYHDIDALLEQSEPDAVMIGTTCNFHTEYAMKVMALDLPLFLEKPVSITKEQVER